MMRFFRDAADVLADSFRLWDLASFGFPLLLRFKLCAGESADVCCLEQYGDQERSTGILACVLFHSDRPFLRKSRYAWWFLVDPEKLAMTFSSGSRIA